MRPLAYRLRLAALLAICVGGGLLFGGLVAGVAKADPYQPDQVAINYTLRNGDAVCDVMDEYPSVAGVMGIVEAIVEDGLTPVQAGQVVGMSVTAICPRHTTLMMRFINQFASYSQPAAVITEHVGVVLR